MRTYGLVLLIMVWFGLLGCKSTQDVALAASQLHYEPKPDDEWIMRQADALIRTGLKDPDSLKNLVLTDSFKCYTSKLEFADNVSPKYNHGYWCYKFHYQATNSYGGYVRGYTPLLYRGGRLHRAWGDEVIRRADNYYDGI